jgi:hypothetical protein
MRSLYKMSRTAGVGLGDYAAVNVLSVIGLLLGLGSVLALIFADASFMLVIPLAALVVCVIAATQIVRSNGTQTGLLLAGIGLLGALGFGGTTLAGRFTQAAAEKRDRAAIESLVEQFEQNVLKRDFAAAYQQFDERFKEDVKFETFERTVAFRIDNLFGPGRKVQDMTLGPVAVFDRDKQTGRYVCQALLIINGDGKYSDGSAMRSQEPIGVEYIDGNWQFHTLSNWFEAAGGRRRTPT